MSVRDEAEALLSRYSFSGMLAPFSLRLSLAPGSPISRSKPIYCLVTMDVPDSGGSGTFEAITAFSIRLDRDHEENHMRILSAVVECLLHETAEGLDFDGQKPFNPHGSDESIRNWKRWYNWTRGNP